MPTSSVNCNNLLQVDTLPLNARQLCGFKAENDPTDRHVKSLGHQDIKRVMSDWQKTNSPLWSYWGKLLGEVNGLKYYQMDAILYEYSPWIAYGLPYSRHQAVDEMHSVCKYENFVLSNGT